MRGATGRRRTTLRRKRRRRRTAPCPTGTPPSSTTTTARTTERLSLRPGGSRSAGGPQPLHPPPLPAPTERMGTPESPSAPLSPLWDRSSGEGGGGEAEHRCSSISPPQSSLPFTHCLKGVRGGSCPQRPVSPPHPHPPLMPVLWEEGRGGRGGSDPQSPPLEERMKSGRDLGQHGAVGSALPPPFSPPLSVGLRCAPPGRPRGIEGTEEQ